jgi:tRNA threonylcarbamoyladenosine biosynthesis protein TsaB
VILAFDTATPATTVALSGLLVTGENQRERTLELRDDPPRGERPRHATRLLGLITELLDQAGTDWETIDRLGVGVGPGTFTGLRIGIATAKALARAAEIPLVGVSTLHSLALNVVRSSAPGQPRVVAAVLDARRGEAFAAAWEVSRLPGVGEPPALAPGAISPEALVSVLAALGPGLMAIGDGALAFRDDLERGQVYVPDEASELHRVTAAGHCRLARLLPVTPPDELHPDYQRPPDAQPRPALSLAARPPHGH